MFFLKKTFIFQSKCIRHECVLKTLPYDQGEEPYVGEEEPRQRL